MQTPNSHSKSSDGISRGGELIDKEDLRRWLSLPSVRMVGELMRERKVACSRLGHRAVRFSWPKVHGALARFEHRAAWRIRWSFVKGGRFAVDGRSCDFGECLFGIERAEELKDGNNNL